MSNPVSPTGLGYRDQPGILAVYARRRAGSRRSDAVLVIDRLGRVEAVNINEANTICDCFTQVLESPIS